MTKRKKAAVLAIIALITIFITTIRFVKGTISSIQTSFIADDYISLSIDNDNFLFDTGADITVLYSDTVPKSFFFFSNTKITDISGNESSWKKYFSFHANFKEFRTTMQTIILIPKKYQSKGLNGIIGADIINRSNWNIDFKNHRIDNTSLARKKPDLTIHYQLKRNLLYADIILDSLLLRNIMIDTGYTRSDFLLEKEYINQIKQLQFTKNDSCYNFTNTVELIGIYTAKECNIFNKYYKLITFTKSMSHNLIGLPFFKRFSVIYIDTYKKEILCYD